jgi:short-subunit dehydrogenase
LMKKKAKRDKTPLFELVSLKNKTALITGSGTGIGEAIAYRYAEAGANLELVDLNEGRLNKVKEDLRQFNTEINIHKVNLSRQEEISVLWQKLEGREPEILVNNAGIYPAKSFLDVDAAFLKNVMDQVLRF